MTHADVIRDILALAMNAPSGDNAQPWKFKVGDSSVTIFNIPDKDGTLYNFRQRGSLISHGAVIENISIAADHFGLTASVTLFPGEENATAMITFTDGGSSDQTLFDAIPKRATNRKPYNKKPLSTEDAAVLHTTQEESSVSLRLIENRNDIKNLSIALSLNEQLLMENKELHDFLFGMIRWTKEDEKRISGLYVKTMEFPFPVQLLLRHVVIHWGATQFLNRIGLSKAIPKQTAALYETSSAFGALCIKNTRDTSFIECGRTLQRLWLTATARGLQVQPVTALPYLMQRIKEKDTRSLSIEHQTLIAEAYREIENVFGITGGDQTIAFIFRVGYGDAPTATSMKHPPVLIA